MFQSTLVKRIVSITVLAAILFTSLPSLSSSHSVSAAASSCSLEIKALDNQHDWLIHLEESYEQSMYYANEPFHHEYREDHLDNAQSALALIVSTIKYIGNLLGSLGQCSSIGNYSYEQVEQIMKNILLQLSTPFYNRDIGLQQLGFDQLYSRMILNIKKLEDHDQFKELYRNVVLLDAEARETTNRYINNLLTGIGDRTLYRYPSYAEDAALMSNLSIVTDGLLLAKKHIQDFIKNVESLSLDSTYNQNQKGKIAAAGLSSIKSIAKDNVKSMGLRAVYKTAIEQRMIYPNMDPTQKAFSEDFAGNLASFMISTDYISFALSYMELVGDLYDHINDQLGKVFHAAQDDAAEYERLKEDADKKQQLFVKVNEFAQDIGHAKMKTSYTEAQYVKQFDTSFQRLIDDVKDIYDLDPTEIKIYVNGKRLNIPEKAYIENGTTMVPLRVISEELNVKPIWNSKNQTITITTTKNMLSLGKPLDVVFTIGSKSVQIGRYYSSVPVAPTVKHGVTFVPLSFVAQNLGLKVEWIAASRSVVLTSR